MLDFPDDFVDYLASSRVESFTVGVATYGDGQREFGVAPSGSVSFDASGEVQSDCSFTAFGGDEGSMVPKSRTDWFAPNGQEVQLFRVVPYGESEYRIPLGVFRVKDWDNGVESVLLTGDPVVVAPEDALSEAEPGLYALPPEWVESPAGSGVFPVPEGWVEDPPGSGLYAFPAMQDAYSAVQAVVVSWSVDVSGADRVRMLQRARLLSEKNPQEATMYAELQRLLLFPMAENPSIPDVVIPSGMVYEGGLVDAVYQLADLAAAVPHMSREGVLTLRLKDAWAVPDLAPVFDISGTIDWQDGMSDEFYNRVRASDPEGKFVAWAALEDDAHPLSVDRAGPSDYEHVSPLYTSVAAAKSGAATVLERVLNRRSREVVVTCGLEALVLELGDLGWVRDPVQNRAVLGEVRRIDVPLDPSEPVSLSLIVAESI